MKKQLYRKELTGRCGSGPAKSGPNLFDEKRGSSPSFFPAGLSACFGDWARGGGGKGIVAGDVVVAAEKDPGAGNGGNGRGAEGFGGGGNEVGIDGGGNEEGLGGGGKEVGLGGGGNELGAGAGAERGIPDGGGPPRPPV